MSTERDELASIIMSPESFDGGPVSCGPNDVYAARTAEAILSDGYRKPRQVATVEELDALPVESVVRSDMGNVYVKDYDLDDPSAIWWVTAGAVSEFQSSRIALPATVIHVGGAE